MTRGKTQKDTSSTGNQKQIRTYPDSRSYIKNLPLAQRTPATPPSNITSQVESEFNKKIL